MDGRFGGRGGGSMASSPLCICQADSRGPGRVSDSLSWLKYSSTSSKRHEDGRALVM